MDRLAENRLRYIAEYGHVADFGEPTAMAKELLELRAWADYDGPLNAAWEHALNGVIHNPTRAMIEAGVKTLKGRVAVAERYARVLEDSINSEPPDSDIEEVLHIQARDISILRGLVTKAIQSVLAAAEDGRAPALGVWLSAATEFGAYEGELSGDAGEMLSAWQERLEVSRP